MPACLPICPEVRAHLRKLVIEAPHLAEEKKIFQRDKKIDPESDKFAISKRKADDSDGESKETLIASARTKISADVPNDTNYERRYSRDTTKEESKDERKEREKREEKEQERRKKDEINGPVDGNNEGKIKLISEKDSEDNSARRKSSEESKSQKSRSDKLEAVVARAPSTDAPQLSSTKVSTSSRNASSIVEKSSNVPKGSVKSEREKESDLRVAGTPTESSLGIANKETFERRVDYVGEDLTQVQDGPQEFECQDRCPQRLSKKRRIRKLEDERQRCVDNYLLSKGRNYFEDVCTCSLGCIVHALRNDPFVQNLLTSVSLFTLGIKLSLELDAWYVPPPVS